MIKSRRNKCSVTQQITRTVNYKWSTLIVDLYKQLEVIHAQCRVRKFSDRETMDVMRLCIYACLERFPARPHNLPSRNQVLTSVRETAVSDH